MLPSARDLTRAEPTTVLSGIAATRAALGVAMLGAPRWCWRLLTPSGGHNDDAVLAVRMLGGRELALGLGGVMAARRAGAVRGWGEAGVLADAADAVTLATSPALVGWRRPATVASAAGVALVGAVAARMASRSG